MNLQAALDQFLIQLQADGRSTHTVAQYRRYVREFQDWWAGDDVGAIGHRDIAAFLAAPETRASRRAVTMNALRTSLRMFFRYLHEAGVVAQNPARLVRRALTGVPMPRTLTDDERDRFLAAVTVHPRDHLLFNLMLSTGIRVGSAVALDVEDVDMDRRELRIRTAKGDRPEAVYLGSAIVDHLRGYLGERRSGPLFPGRGSDRLTTRHVRRRFAAWGRTAGIARRASPHTLRHTFATTLLRRCGDVTVVQAALRHRSITSTLVYARAREDQVKSAMA